MADFVVSQIYNYTIQTQLLEGHVHVPHIALKAGIHEIIQPGPKPIIDPKAGEIIKAGGQLALPGQNLLRRGTPLGQKDLVAGNPSKCRHKKGKPARDPNIGKGIDA